MQKYTFNLIFQKMSGPTYLKTKGWCLELAVLTGITGNTGAQWLYRYDQQYRYVPQGT